MNLSPRRFALRSIVTALLLSASACAARAADATLSLAPIFSDHMVLQRDIKLPVWGKAAPGAKVTVSLGDATQEATADDKGAWRVNFEPLKAGGQPLAMAVASGADKLQFSDILVGDVWVASGQSNMEWPVKASLDPEKEIAAAKWPQIRFVDVPNVTADAPVDSFQSKGWQAVTPENIADFSAVAYFFARDLNEHLKVPVGLIGCNWGGTPMEAWTSREALESSPTFKESTAKSYDPPASPEEAEQRKNMAAHMPGRLFNGMTSAVIPYGIRGAIWYQGESNAGRNQQYAELSKLMITDWRTRWGQGDFPFLLVQLAAFEPGGEAWPPLREAQLETLQLPKTGMAVTTDVGDRTDIHPKDKQTVGKRLALAARGIAFGEKIVYSGPIFKEMKVDGSNATLKFDHVGGGLKAEGPLKGFEVAGADGKFVPAAASIEGEQVVVHSDAVTEPKTVRYNWAAFPDGNLFNAEGLPASPFRSSK